MRSPDREIRILDCGCGSSYLTLAAHHYLNDVLGLPTVWIPHSYAGCSQHAPDEHLLAPVVREALGIMAGLWWDLGEPT